MSITVDENLLSKARAANPQHNDGSLFDAALTALLARPQSAVSDDGYCAYDDHPIDGPDEWGDLQSFRSEAAAT